MRDPERAAAVAGEVGGGAASIEAAIDGAEARRHRRGYERPPGADPGGDRPRGLPIFCEKPLAVDLAETRRLADEIEASRHSVPARLPAPLRRRLRRGAPAASRAASSARSTSFRLAGHDPAPPHEAYIPASGGLFRDFSIHDFDVTPLADRPGGRRGLRGRRGARRSPMFAKYDDVDTAVATLRLAGGALARSCRDRHDPLGYDIRTELFGSRDSVSVGLGPRTPMRSVEPGVPPPAGPAWASLLDRFARCAIERARRVPAGRATGRRKAPARREIGSGGGAAWRSRRRDRSPSTGRCEGWPEVM